MIIDIHNHAEYHGYSAEKMLQNMDENNIDLCCLMSWECPLNEYDPATKRAFSPLSEAPILFERCLAYKEKFPGRFLLGYAPDPRLPDSISRLQAAINLYDICMYGEMKLRMMYDNPDAVRMYRFCGENGLPVLMHFDYELGGGSYPWPNYWYGGGIDALERVLALCPETNFIGHAPGFWAHISNDELYKSEAYPKGPVVPGGKIEILLEKYPNLYCDISAGSGHNALSRDVENASRFLQTWQSRVLFGRDYYDGIHQELLSSLALPAETLDNIYCQNARRILRNGEKIQVAARNL
ncbi:MAG: amidohydrolase [Oscillospiraceae bacterium]|nr:amidohydrolase [Oscillospiraceae bacterium]